jgi:lysophospholipase L1-like esterase
MRSSAAFLTVPLMVVTLSAQQPAAPATAAPQAVAGQSDPELAAAISRLLANDARQRDWAQLGRYREQNRALARPAAAESRVVFMGDSITDAWPRYGELFASNKSYIGRGISGQTTPQMLVRFRPDVIDLHPKAVVILAGTNDIAGNSGPMTNEDIQNNLMSMAELAKAHKIKVILSSITPTSAYHVGPTGVPQTRTRPMERIRALNDWMKKYAAAEGHAYLDYFSAMLDQTGMFRTELSGDDLHPNAQGYAIMAPLAEAAIKQALR